MSFFLPVCGAVVVALALGCVGCGRATEEPPATASGEDGADEAAASRELVELGLAFARAGDSVRGEQYLSAALDAGADPNQALLALMQLCIKAGRFEAAAQYGEAYERDVLAKRELAMLLSGLYISLDQDDKAIKRLEQVAGDYPELALAHLLLGRLLRQKERDLEQADAHFRGYLRLEPEGIYAREARASLLKRLSDVETLPRVVPDEPRSR